MESKKLSKFIELIFLSIAWLSVLACLIRTDFNFPFAFFFYYLWISRDDKANSLMVFNHSLSNVVDGFEWNPNLGRPNLAIICWIHLDSNRVKQSCMGTLTWSSCLCYIYQRCNVILKVGAIAAINSYRGNQTQVTASVQNPQQSGVNDFSQNRQVPYGFN